jgi:Uma2 family endonuclease
MPNMLDSPVTTVEQLLELHEPGFSHELVRGELRRMSNAGWWHGAIAAAIGDYLYTHVRTRRLGIAFAAETGFVLARNPDTVRSPDASFVRTGRLPTTPGPGLFVGAPDLAVEVTSPSDTFTAVHEKALDWLAHGAREVWVVEADTRTLRVYRPGGAMQFLATTDTLRGGDVLPGFEVPVADLFPSLA